ncbi:MAG: cation transporter [Clostridiales bacterium]|nr:cation transporter [Clostridiales bacterium]
MKTKRKIFIAFILNLLFSIFEFVGGIITGSVAIASDAVHDFGDATSIGVSYVLEKLSDKKPNEKYTYGYARFSILGALITTLILLVSSCIVIYNALLRLINLEPIDYNGMIIFAVIGLTVNIVATYFTHGGKSINQKAVNLHMLEDVLGWLVVLIGAIVIRFTNCFLIDPILSILLSLFVIVNSIKNLIQILEIFLIRTPKNVDVNELIKHVKSVDGVLDVHHLHVWSIDGQINCATLHVVANEYNAQIKERVKEEFNEHGILHVVVEIETNKEKCEHKTCEIKSHESHHHHHHCHHHH